jgi:integrin alpha 8
MKSQQDGEPIRPDLETGVTNLEKLAQGRGGFQTSTFELPQVQRNNVDEDLRHRSQQTWAANGNSGSGATSHQSGGGGSGSRQSSSWQSSSGQATGRDGDSRTYSSTYRGAQGETAGKEGGSRTYSSGTAQGEAAAGGGQTSHSSRTSWSSTGGGNAGSSSSPAASSTNQQHSYDDDDYSFDEYDGIEDEFSSHNVDDTRGESGSHTNKQHNRQHDQQQDGVDDKFKHYQRFRRQAFDDDSDEELKKALKCDATRCAILRCVAGPLLNQKEAWIALRTRLVASTMHKIGSSVPLTTSTMAVARISKLPYIGTPKERQIKTHELQVKATPEPTAAPDVVPLWVVVLAACAGTIILLLLIYLLYKVS